MYQLSVLLPSAYQDKRERFLQNMRETVSDFNSIEIVVCLDGELETWRDGNIVYTYAPPSRYRGSFFNAAWRASTGRFLLMGNDDILFKTKGWDKMIPYDKYPDDIVLFYFKDNQFNEFFSCHPVWSRKVMELDSDLFEPSYQITKCDNTIWDIHPTFRRIYLPEIVLDHVQTPYGPEWKSAYDQDNRLYMETTAQRIAVKNKILGELGMLDNKVMIATVTGEFGRRADFYDHRDVMEKPTNSLSIGVHGPSVAYNRNRVAEQALVHNCSHIFFIDDDTVCRPDILYRLLAHNKDIVCGFQLKRDFPHFPLLFKEKVDTTRARIPQLSELSTGLIPVYGAGLGAILIKTEIFHKLDKPWFRLGEIQKDQISEDTGFFARAADAGIDVYCDLDTQVGHQASMTIWPARKEDTWHINYDSNGSGSVAFAPKYYPEKELKNVIDRAARKN